MSTNKSNKPELRFKGFSDDWEQRKVGELLSERIEQFPKSDEYPLMAFVANEGVAPKGDRYDRSALVNDTEGKLYKRTEFGDFIYSSNNLETGSIGLNKYGNATISPVYSIFRPTGIADSDFIGRRFIRKDFINEMVKWRQGVIYGQWKIHEEDFLKIEVMVPSLEEQRLIGSFLDNLDHLITLHQRKCDNLKIIKKSMLDNLFPKIGEKVPKWRFKGFNNDWEQRKLGELLSFLKDGTHGTHADVDDGPLLLSAKNIKNGGIYWDETDRRISYGEYEKIHSNFSLESGDVLLTIVGSIGETAILKDSEGITFQRSVAFLRPNNKITPDYLYSEIQTPIFQKELDSRKSTSAQPGIYLGDLAEIPLIFSTKIDEQKKIGEYFSNLDHLITLHQSEVERLKKAKQFFLDKMFI